ncbi:nuclear transport factor 2 family protein [Candidatus Poriferisocius sp.]|uniref:nuclear transport factor 2 family protein n=1 Tax=Candidatus Poriferisocius sp. TaxID=3101276 RepID=UPI003B5908C1
MTDRLELADLVATYARCVDRKDPAGVAACFAPDGVLRRIDLPSGGSLLGERTGRDEITQAISRMPYHSTFHFLGQQQIDITGDTASGETYCIAHHLTVPEDGSPSTDFIMFIRYQDEFVRLAEGWRFAGRELHIDWTETRPAECVQS